MFDNTESHLLKEYKTYITIKTIMNNNDIYMTV